MRVRRVLLWIFPVLGIFSGVLLYFLPRILNRADRGFYEHKNQAWTRELGSFAGNIRGGSLGTRDGEIAMAPDGTVWVVGGGVGLTGLHYYEDSQWKHRPGEYTDLAVGPDGEVWAAPIRGESMDVFDGEEWKTYDISGLDPKMSYPQVEIDANGRVWYVTKMGGEAWLSEMTIEDGVVKAGRPIDAVKAEHGAIISLDADPQGNVWASVWTYRDGPPSPNDGLKLFDGEAWRTVDVPRGEPVTRTAFDQESRAWIVTECGSVMRYAGGKWESILEETGDTDCKGAAQLDGFFADARGRLWVWSSSEVRFLERGTWTTVTPQESGISGAESHAQIFGLVVDQQDRAWIATSEGVNIARVEDIQPLSKAEMRAHSTRVGIQEAVQPMWWVVPSIFAFLWLATALSVLPCVVLGAGLGSLVLLLVAAHPLWAVPGLMGLYLGMLCGLLFGLGDQERKTAGSTQRGMVPAFVGWLTGSVAGLGLIYFLAISGAF